MKTKISKNNPFGYNRYGFLWEVLSAENKKAYHLDYGAYNGRVLSLLSKTGVIDRGVGVDLNADVINNSSFNMPDNVKLHAVTPKAELPFEHCLFDSISLLDVIEHIQDQGFVLRQLNSILKSSGIIVITVPQKHLFSFLDMGNFKFIFPRLHKFYYETKYSKKEYKARYFNGQNSLHGDIEKNKMWHQHFTLNELRLLLGKYGFKIRYYDGTGLFLRPLTIMSYFLPGFLKGIFARLIFLDSKLFSCANLFCVAVKQNY